MLHLGSKIPNTAKFYGIWLGCPKIVCFEPLAVFVFGISVSVTASYPVSVVVPGSIRNLKMFQFASR